MEPMSYDEFVQDARLATLEAAIELLWNEVSYLRGAVDELRGQPGNSDQHTCSCGSNHR
jgi:hypothetical protein